MNDPQAREHAPVHRRAPDLPRGLAVLGLIAGCVGHGCVLPAYDTVAGPGCATDSDCTGADACWAGACATLTAVGAGYPETCALTSAGGVVCWGANASGELGNGSFTGSPVAAAVSGLGSGAKAIAVGGDHACAITTAGGVVCWGSNDLSQLGGGTAAPQSAVPVPVSGLSSGVTAIAAGFSHTCALTSGAGVVCWGSNADGQLGTGSTATSAPPAAVSKLSSGVSAIIAGNNDTCVLTAAGDVQCWGLGTFGQLGNGATTSSSVPVAVTVLGMTTVRAIAAGKEHTCAITSAGAVSCWGSNASGQLAQPLGTPSSTKALTVPGLAEGVTALTAGSQYTCALRASGGVECWGDDSSGQLGDGSITTTPVVAPTAVSGLSSGVVAITAAGEVHKEHTCALTIEGQVLCWGYGVDGQLGNGTTAPASAVPVAVKAP